jgi:hypothetical protein
MLNQKFWTLENFFVALCWAMMLKGTDYLTFPLEHGIRQLGHIIIVYGRSVQDGRRQKFSWSTWLSIISISLIFYWEKEFFQFGLLNRYAIVSSKHVIFTCILKMYMRIRTDKFWHDPRTQHKIKGLGLKSLTHLIK